MKNIKLFKTTADYEAAKEFLPSPSVAYDSQTKVTHYKNDNYVEVRYNFTEPIGDLGYPILRTDAPVPFYMLACPCFVDDEYLLDRNYSQFLPTKYSGEHTLKFFIGDSLFKESYLTGTEYTYVNIPYKNSVEFHANGHEFVDLGLPSGTLWATCNVGALSPEQYGDYFMWASTSRNNSTNCISKNAPYRNTSYSETSTSGWKKYKYSGFSLDLSDDAARLLMGGEWQMPSLTQLRELIDNTVSEPFHFGGSGVCKVISKKDSSKFILLPISGYREGTTFRRGLSTSICGLWTNYSANLPYAYGLSYKPYSSLSYDIWFRYIALPIRGVF